MTVPSDLANQAVAAGIATSPEFQVHCALKLLRRLLLRMHIV